ncbi:MAG: hypothetical protein EOP14_05640 [Pseudomonas sp.]|jgi:hypothetical protein|nr:MAG: hypothetical protein EOP14_05640 [Pseudomonas sp.]
MRKLLWVLSALFILAFHVPANAIYYRVVRHGPDKIFQDGFKPWGKNDNFFQHTNGQSCNRHRVAPENRDIEGSKYISLAATLAGALEFARGRLTPARPQIPDPALRLWIYEVRPTQTTYNAALTFERANVNLMQGAMRIPYLNAIVLAEWDDVQAIAPERIRAARQYQLINGQVVEVQGTYVLNPRYVDIPDDPNPNPLPATVLTGTPTFMNRTRTVVAAAAAGLVSACWCESASVGPAKRSTDPTAATSGDSCESGILQFNEIVPRVRYTPVNGWAVEL